MRGDIFTWEYLEQGPEWWDIRVTKKGATILAEDAVTKSPQNETIVNVPSLEPRLKHPTIFRVFDELNPGESMIIHNDHDPKPVYYQLLGERGDIFTWHYVEQGPIWWDIRITKRKEEDAETVGQIAAKDLRKAEVFKKYGIDFCCGGKKTVKEVCNEKGIDYATVEKELQTTSSGITGANNNFNEWNLDFLADYIINTHHNYIRKYLPELRGYATKVARVHGAHHPELISINQLVEDINEELSDHIATEEKVLFPLVKKIVQAKTNGTAYTTEAGLTLQNLTRDMENEHRNVDNLYQEIHKYSNHFAIPADACASYSLFYKMLEEFENDLHVHIHLENNILFPKAVELEKTLS
ncbi:MAG: iron-sulfur cluster repair di-iron protein [Ferruginibacter sp.]|nr:iron-sulfur cluster repair di-iron protein [Bacteroidota bacterium]MCW5916863.1 iron-sulfur cluster repair di-iron protein [Ferruginibacter sp.]